MDSCRALVDVALLSILKAVLLSRSKAGALTWGDLEFPEDGSDLLEVPGSKTDPRRRGTGSVHRPGGCGLSLGAPACGRAAGSKEFGIWAFPRQLSRQVNAAARAAGLGDGFSDHSGRLGMAQDQVKSGVDLPALMTAGRWKSSRMATRYTERRSADRGRVARYNREGSFPPSR